MAEGQNFCAICQEDIFISCTIGGCRFRHKFCFQCFFKWTKNKRRSGVTPRCPVCRDVYLYFYLTIDSESLLNTIERIVYGQNRRHTPLNQYYLRRLIHSPHWNNLDQFWSRMFLIGIVAPNRILLSVLIDSRADIVTTPFIQHFDNNDANCGNIDQFLRNQVNNILCMAMILCNRHENI